MLDQFSCPSPCFVVEEAGLKRNLAILDLVQARTGAKILLALKAFSMYHTFPLLSKSLAGVTASGLYEARLGREEFSGEVHVFSPAYSDAEFTALLPLCDHMVFNSVAQWVRYRDRVGTLSCGLRVNPEYSEIETALYDPCAPYSRLGTTLANLDKSQLHGLDGLHFHTLCEQGADTLARTVRVVEERFGDLLHQMKWLNLGGGHHITRPGYDVELLIETLLHLKNTYDLTLYLEPGEAVALNAGVLVTTVLETLENGMNLAILDASAACHIPDVLEMPYRPELIGAGRPGERAYTYRLGGPTCLAGDIIGDYSFDAPLQPGDRLVFTDMAHYTMVKTNTFNGMPLPSIAYARENGALELVRTFSYEDFKSRL